MSFQQLGLHPELLKTLNKRGYTTPTPIQTQSIPLILKSHDIMGQAQTGTGKTAAFALPLIQKLVQDPQVPRPYRPRVLVLAPTRELAAQVGDSFKAYSKGQHLKTAVIFGGVGQMPQKQALKKGIDILVATPGRLLDLKQQGDLHLNEVEYFVLDEADRMLDMGFIHDIRKVLKALPKQRQNLLFSATFSKEVKKLASAFLLQPKHVQVAQENAAADTVKQSYYAVERQQKRHLLGQLIREEKWNQVLVFTRTKHGANRLARQLGQAGFTTDAIHGNKSQSARKSALAGFKARKIQVLVATDIAARGLDIEYLPCVVNFDLPHVAEDYVHRIGRTGRAKKRGVAVSLVSDEEKSQLKSIEKLMGKRIQKVKNQPEKPVKKA